MSSGLAVFLCPPFPVWMSGMIQSLLMNPPWVIGVSQNQPLTLVYYFLKTFIVSSVSPGLLMFFIIDSLLNIIIIYYF